MGEYRLIGADPEEQAKPPDTWGCAHCGVMEGWVEGRSGKDIPCPECRHRPGWPPLSIKEPR